MKFSSVIAIIICCFTTSINAQDEIDYYGDYGRYIKISFKDIDIVIDKHKFGLDTQGAFYWDYIGRRF